MPRRSWAVEMKFRAILAGAIVTALMVAGPLCLPAALAQAEVITRGPYLQNVTPTSISIIWETSQPTDSVVNYGPTAEYGSVTGNTTPTTRHVITLDGLDTYTTYHYLVGNSTDNLSTDSTLKTAASANQTSFSFAVYGDCRTRIAEHQSVVGGIVTVSPDFYLNTGDLVEDGSNSSQWDSFFEIETELMKTTTLFPSLGNHELNHANYFDLFYLPGNERWYSFDYGNAHFTCLQIDAFTDYSASSEQYSWLEQDLAGSNQTWKFVFFHLPPYSSGRHGNDLNVLAVRDVLPPLFEEHEVDMVFNGHDHDYERSLINDVTYIVSGGGGAPLYQKQFTNDWTIYFESTLHFVHINIDGNSLTSVGIKPDGSQFDSFNLQKYTLTVSSTNGGAVVVPGEGTFTYRDGASMIITAAPNAGWQFDHWTGNVTDANSSNTTVTMDSDKTVTASFSQIPSPPAEDGGGGGGGGPTGINPVINSVTEKGRFVEDVTAKSVDRKVELYIPKDTVGLNRVGQMLSSILIKEKEDPPARPAESEFVGSVYYIGPEGANFTPPINLTIKYDQSKLPNEVAEKNLVLATFGKSIDQWVELESIVDTEDNIVTAKVSHFTEFSILAYTRPASFTVSDLSIVPDEAELEESIIISALVTNNGDLTGSYEVALNLDGVTVERKEVIISGRNSEVVDFNIYAKAAGEHSVAIDGLQGEFHIASPLSPADLTISDVSIYPTEATPGEQVDIKVSITNNGERTGTREVTLKINEEIVEVRDITVAGGSSQAVIFSVIRDDPETYMVDVNGLSGSFTVVEEITVTEEEEVTAAPPILEVPEVVIPPAVTTEPSKNQQWWLIGLSVFFGILIITLLIYFLVWRRAKM